MLKQLSLEKIFVLITLFFGVLYIFILPPFQSVDEGMHFFRTYQISQGDLVARKQNMEVGGVIPASLGNFYGMYVPLIKNINKKVGLSDFKNNFHLKLNPEKQKFTVFTNTALYSPICYISQIPGVCLGKFLDLSLAGIYYLGRLSNLIFYCLLIYAALKITPFFKYPMFLLAVMPMSLSLAASYTSDVAVLGLNFLWVATILKILTLQTPIKVNNKWIILLLFLGLLIPMTKSYILLLPLIFVLPINIFKTKKDYLISVLSIFAIGIIGFSFWTSCIKGLSFDMNNNTFANSEMQIAFIKTHPLAYMLVLIKTFIVKTPRILITMIGVLGWQDTKLDWITYMAYPILMYYAVVTDNYQFILKKWQKLLIVCVICFGIIAIYTSLYIMWSPVANSVVLGLNGKYFIPLVLPLCLLFKTKSAKYNYEYFNVVMIIAVIFILISSELSLLHRFYNLTPQLYYKI